MARIPRFVLVVDDNRMLRSEETFGVVTYALTSDAALRELNEQRFDDVWLDHDLGGDDTTMPVVDWLVQYPDRGPERVIVHTQNPVGRQQIIAALEPLYEIERVVDVSPWLRRRGPRD